MMDTSSTFLKQLTSILTIFAVIISTMPILVIGMVPVILASIYVAHVYNCSARELKRLDSTTRSPVLSHFAETVNGVTTIRAFGRQQHFLEENARFLDANNRVYHHLWTANRYLAVRLQVLGAITTGMVGLYIALTLGDIPGRDAGLVLLYSMSFSDAMNTLIRSQAELEMNFNSVERVAVEYSQELEQEAAPINPQHRPSSMDWPSQGEIVVQDLSMRYPSSEKDVLHKLTFRIPPKVSGKMV